MGFLPPAMGLGSEQHDDGDQLEPMPDKSLGDIFISTSWLAAQPGTCCPSRGWS